jgi:hypothetical protein
VAPELQLDGQRSNIVPTLWTTSPSSAWRDRLHATPRSNRVVPFRRLGIRRDRRRALRPSLLPSRRCPSTGEGRTIPECELADRATAEPTRVACRKRPSFTPRPSDRRR